MMSIYARGIDMSDNATKLAKAAIHQAHVWDLLREVEADVPRHATQEDTPT